MTTSQTYWGSAGVMMKMLDESRGGDGAACGVGEGPARGENEWIDHPKATGATSRGPRRRDWQRLSKQALGKRCLPG
jgi:hypothetical protein